MNMLASLKSLLFSSTPLAATAATGAADVVEGAMDFAAMLSDADGAKDAAPAPGQGDVASTATGEGEAEAMVQPPETAALPVMTDTADYLAQRNLHTQPLASATPVPAMPGEVAVMDVPVTVSPPVLPQGDAPAQVVSDSDIENVEISQPLSDATLVTAPNPTLPLPAISGAQPTVEHDTEIDTRMVPAQPDAAAPVRDAIAPSLPAALPPLPQAPIDAPASSIPSASADEMPLHLSSSPSLSLPQSQAPSYPAMAEADMTDNVVDADGQDDEHKDAEISVAAPAMPSDLAAAAMAVPPMPMSMPVVPVAVDPPVMVASVEEAGEPASQPLRPVPSNVVQVEDGLTPSDPSAEAEPNKKGDPIAVAAGKAQPPAQRSTSQAALPTDRPTASVDAVDDAPVPLAVPLAAPSVAPSAAPPLPSVDASEQVVAQTDRSEPPVPPGVDGSKATPGDQGMPIPVAVNQAAEPASVVEPASAIEPAATIAAPVRAEALSLLQLVRDHMNRRAMPSRDAADPAPAVGDRNEATRAVDPSLAMPTPSAHHGTTVAAPLAAAAQGANTAPAAMPTVDLSASLGQQVVDLGVSGQWIDGLARDIAGLSANGAQGRFQINADQLGPVQVDIRQGSDGAAVSLTVASEAAEIALRQDSDRLKLDAGLAAVRISEVKVERAPHVAEAQRADSQSGGQQSSAQQGQSGQQGAWQNGGQMAGQSMGQSSSQGRWQGRENNGPGHKSGGDPAVLNHGDAGDSAGDVRRARYA